MNRLADLILAEMDRKGYSAKCFAELCGVNRDELGRIINRKKKDVKMSFIWNVCENSEIRISDVFNVKHSEKIEKFILTNGYEKYCLKRM